MVAKVVTLQAVGEEKSGRSTLLWHISRHLRALGFSTYVDGHSLRVEGTGQQFSHLHELRPHHPKAKTTEVHP